MNLSRRTLAAFAEAIDRRTSQAAMDGLVFEFNTEESDVGGSVNKRAVAFVRHITERRDEKGIFEVVLELIPRLHVESGDPVMDRLIEALRIDGYEVSSDRLIPTTPEPAALGPLVSVLEQNLEHNQYAIAKGHYQQAVDNFVGGNWEAANGQIRSFIENFVITLCASITSKTRVEPKAALQDLRDKAIIDDAEWNQMRGFWAGIQDNGPHHGLSSRQEALFRLHVATAIVRYLLDKISNQ